jgi:hypothetical protein
MRRSSGLSLLERCLAVVLAAVWLCAGGMGVYAGVTQARWVVAAIASAAFVYGMAWLRVALRARLLSWSELVVPWRRLR